TGLLVGTPQFAAPEVAAGGRAEPPSDVYSFALCLYLMLSGSRAPFVLDDEASPAQWLAAHREGRPRPIAELGPAVPAPLAALVDRALSKDPRIRPTAVEAAKVLDALRDGSPVTEVTARPRRRPAAVAGVTGVSLAAAAGLAFWAAGSAATNAPPEPPVRPAAVRPADAPAPAVEARVEASPAAPAAVLA